MKTAVTAIALGLALIAAPALAAPSPNSAKLTAHMEALQTEKAAACMAESQDPAATIAACQAAQAELAAARKAAPQASIGEKANFDFVESVLISSLAAAYANIDAAPTARVCTAFENLWTLRYGLLSVPENEVPAEAYTAFHDVPQEVGPILDVCRSKFGTPAGASPRPAA